MRVLDALLMMVMMSVGVCRQIALHLKQYGGYTGDAALMSVLTSTSQPQCSIFLITDNSTLISSSIYQRLANAVEVGSVVAFDVNVNVDANSTKIHLLQVITDTIQMRQEAQCVTMVTASDDPIFLTTVVESSYEGSLLLWQTRLLVLTRLHPSSIYHLHSIFSTTNSMILVINNNTTINTTPRCSVYMYYPYCPDPCTPFLLASWDYNRGIVYTSHYPLFPEKFQRFHYRPTLNIGTTSRVSQTILVDDPDSPGGKRRIQTSYKGKIMEALAYKLNFSYTLKFNPDGLIGAPNSNGSWSGIIGMLIRKEADMASELSGMNPIRTKVVDFTMVMGFDKMRLLARMGTPKMNPWGFLLPLTSLVWLAILTTSICVLAALTLLPYFFPLSTSDTHSWITKWITDVPVVIRILLQQDIRNEFLLLWERVIIGMWMLSMLVLTRSYAGNLMSLLAVQHVPMPYQSLSDVLHHPSATMLWEKDTVHLQYIRSVKSGIFKDVGDFERTGRLATKHIRGIHVAVADNTLKDNQVVVIEYMGQLYAKHYAFLASGRCNYYSSKESFLNRGFAWMVQKGSPIVPALNKRLWQLQWSGLLMKWYIEGASKSSYCLNLPSKFTVQSALSINNLLGVFVVLMVSAGVGVLMLCLELIINRLKKNC